MVTEFLDSAKECFLKSFPRSQPMNRNYFAREIIAGLEDVCHPKGRNSHESQMIFHFDNASMHNTEKSLDN
jgi:hypothetical protein